MFMLSSILHVEMLLKVTYSAYKRKYYDSLLHVYYDIRRNPKNGWKMTFTVELFNVSRIV